MLAYMHTVRTGRRLLNTQIKQESTRNYKYIQELECQVYIHNEGGSYNIHSCVCEYPWTVRYTNSEINKRLFI